MQNRFLFSFAFSFVHKVVWVSRFRSLLFKQFRDVSWWMEGERVTTTTSLYFTVMVSSFRGFLFAAYSNCESINYSCLKYFTRCSIDRFLRKTKKNHRLNRRKNTFSLYKGTTVATSNKIFMFLCILLDWTILTANRCLNVCKREFHTIFFFFCFFSDRIVIFLHFPCPTHFSCFCRLSLVFVLTEGWMFNICKRLKELVGWIEYFDVGHNSSSVSHKLPEYHHWHSIVLRSIHMSYSFHLIIQFNNACWDERNKIERIAREGKIEKEKFVRNCLHS